MPKRARPLLLLAALTLAAGPALARDSLGMFAGWGAFRDGAVPRCYAIAMADPWHKAHDYQPYADVGSWPKRGIRGALHIRVSHKLAANTPIILAIAGQHFRLVGGGGDAWSQDARMDAAIVSAMRSAPDMTVSAHNADGRPFTDTFQLAGAASAMDAALLGCANLR